uniref:Uncharacterized protein n=1 Tax=Leersia perrieri TaxID=77586 RepID=A0A0D9V4N4_9ORYZ
MAMNFGEFRRGNQNPSFCISALATMIQATIGGAALRENEEEMINKLFCIGVNRQGGLVDEMERRMVLTAMAER